MKNESKEIIQYDHISGISITYENAPTSFPVHWHSAAEFTVILQDNCRYRIGDTEYTAMAGDVVLVWPRELHEVISVPKDGSVFIQFSSSLLENNLDLVSLSRILTRHHIIENKKEPVLTGAIHEKIMRIKEIFQSNDYLSETRCKLITGEIILLISEYILREQQASLGPENDMNRSGERIRAILNYIAEHAADELTEAEVASAVGLSPYYFSKLFRKYMQMSFPAYLSSVRVKNAIRLLADEKLSITDCAFLAGFQSTTTFNKAFRELTDYSPREYRKMYIV